MAFGAGSGRRTCRSDSSDPSGLKRPPGAVPPSRHVSLDVQRLFPMILLSVEELVRQFDADPVLDRVSFEVRAGEKIGVVGPNGCGKTTLLRILAGHDEPDDGRVERAPGCSVGLLEQEPHFDSGRTLFEEARQGLAHLYRLQEEAAQVSRQMASATDSHQLERLHKRYDFLQQELDRLDAFNLDHRVDEVLHGLGFSSADYDRPVHTFSGGQQSRVLLAKLLLQSPDLLLLDEPTNHLDLAATEWLEQFLQRVKKAVVLVSHDRYFLDRVVGRIFELNRGRLTAYTGNFTAYWRQRAARHETLLRTYEKQQEFIRKTEEFIRRNRYGQKHAQAADRKKKLERLQRVEKPHEIPVPPMTFGARRRSGDWVVDARHVSKAFDRTLFEDLTVQIFRGDRVAVLGPNGSGKTTLLRVLIGELAPDHGSVRLGHGVTVGYCDQQLRVLDPTLDAVENTRPPNRPEVTPGDLRSLLARFGLSGDVVLQPVGTMSGGEKTKVALAKLAAQQANLLVLDEPTNHLDLWARAGLEQALRQFEGTVLFVSHDRYFVDQVATKVLVLDPPRWAFFEGNYSDYQHFVQQTRAEASGPADSAAEQKQTATAARDRRRSKPRRKRKFPYRKVEDIERDVAEKEKLLEELQQQMADPDVHRDPERIKSVMQAYEQTRAELDLLYEHWEEALELN